MPESRFVTQDIILQSLASYESNKFSPEVTREQDIMNTSTRIQLTNKPTQNEKVTKPSKPEEDPLQKTANNTTRKQNKEFLSMMKILQSKHK
jgi:hypothetical protein